MYILIRVTALIFHVWRARARSESQNKQKLVHLNGNISTAF